jgi:hypothetical protein
MLSFYWARFSPEYLNIVRNRNLRDLQALPKITLHHTKPLSLIVKEERAKAFEDFISVIRCVAGGYSKVGHLRKDMETCIHRTGPEMAG